LDELDIPIDQVSKARVQSTARGIFI
jgi:hypothetical protein